MSAARTANINVRVEPQAKKGAEEVFDSLGISTADAVNIFLKQVVYRQAIPFDLGVPMAPKHLDATYWSKEKLQEEIQKGIDSAKEGPLYSIDEVFDELQEKRYATVQS